MTRVLVAQASRDGATRSIAERIAAGLRARGLAAGCLPVTAPEVSLALGRYEAVLIGSAVHGRAWLPEAVDFVERYAADLAARPVWLFSVGMVDALARPLRRLAAKEGDLAVAPFLASVQPRGTRLFSGVASREQFPALSRTLLMLAGTRFGDLRDWPAVDAWTAEIAAELGRGT